MCRHISHTLVLNLLRVHCHLCDQVLKIPVSGSFAVPSKLSRLVTLVVVCLCWKQGPIWIMVKIWTLTLMQNVFQAISILDFANFPTSVLYKHRIYISIQGARFGPCFFHILVWSPYFPSAGTCREYGLTLSMVSPVCVHLVVFMTACRLLSFSRDVAGAHGLASVYLSIR